MSHKHLLPVLVILVAMLAACQTNKKSPANPDTIEAEFFYVVLNRDTVIETKEGALIKIPAGSITSKSSNVAKIGIKQAFSIEEMIKGGLITTSNHEPLSSGGMIDIFAAEGNDVTIAKSLTVSIPTLYTQQGMEVFKGISNPDGKIDWTAPYELEKKDTLPGTSEGKQIFRSYCASCHNIASDATGPALAFIPERRDKKWLAAWIHNSVKLIANGDRYANCLFEHWHKTMQTCFPDLSEQELEKLYTYLMEESRNIDPAQVKDFKKSFDSCQIYNSLKTELAEKKAKLEHSKGQFLSKINELKEVHGKAIERRQKLIEENSEMVTLKDTIMASRRAIIAGNKQNKITNAKSNSSNIGNQNPAAIPPGIFANQKKPKELVNIKELGATYYQFKIETFGWYNIDIFLKGLPGFEDRELFVRVIGQYKSEVNIYLAIPGRKILVPGGESKTGNGYCFFEDNGKIPLPLNLQGYIIAMGESEGKLLFGMTDFKVANQQSLSLEVRVVTKEEMNISISRIDLGGMKIEAADSKNADSIRAMDTLKQKTTDSLNTLNGVITAYTDSIEATEKRLVNLEFLKPKFCNCDCGLNSDSTVSERDFSDTTALFQHKGFPEPTYPIKKIKL